MVAQYTFRELTPAERALLGPILAEGLKDPESARWEWLPIRSDVKDGTIDYCGRVNSKNGYGGYAGSHIYNARITIAKGVVTGGRISGIATDAENVEFIFAKVCRDFGLPI